MSARVLHPILLGELYTIRSPTALKRAFPNNRKLNDIKKALFGPTNSVENKRIFEDEIHRHQDIACRKWGFDFRNGYPLSGHNQYLWERVSFDDFIPEVYALSRAAHIREDTVFDTTEEDILMDERAARQNSPVVGDKVFLPDVIPITDCRLAPSASTSTGKRQPKITEYMKERKRLAPTPKKLSPVKRLRTSVPLTSIGHGTTDRSKMP